MISTDTGCRRTKARRNEWGGTFKIKTSKNRKYPKYAVKFTHKKAASDELGDLVRISQVICMNTFYLPLSFLVKENIIQPMNLPENKPRLCDSVEVG